MPLPYSLWTCCGCGKTPSDGVDLSERFSLSIYAGRWCEECWRNSGYRKEPASAFSPEDAGESYDPD